MYVLFYDLATIAAILILIIDPKANAIPATKGTAKHCPKNDAGSDTDTVGVSLGLAWCAPI